MKKTIKLQNHPIPLRLDGEHHALLSEYCEANGLPRTFVIRRCIQHTLKKFISGEIDIITLKTK